MIKAIDTLDDKTVINISGNATANYISDIKNEINKIIINKKIVAIDIAALEDIDLTFLQLLISLNNYLVKKKSELQIINYDSSEKFMKILKYTGLNKVLINLMKNEQK